MNKDELLALADPIVLVAADDPDRKPKLFACRTCGVGYWVRDIGVQNARDMALNCKTCNPKQYVCDTCGKDTPQYWFRCNECQVQIKLDAAVEIEDNGGPYFEFGGDRYYHEIEDASDDGVAWVSPCTVTYPRLDVDSILESLLDDMHEDASTDDLDGIEDFAVAVAKFNEAQKTASYRPDEKRKIRVPALAHRSQNDG